MVRDEIFDVAGRTAVVTGASSGLGRRMAQVLALRGVTVTAVARRGDRLRDLAATQDGIVPHECDVTDDGSVEGLARDVVDRFGVPDIVVNAAGVVHAGSPRSETVDDFRAVVEVNLVGAYSMCRVFGDAMARRGSGSIVNVAWIFGIVAPSPLGGAGYAASKAGVIQLSRQLAKQWAKDAVRVNCIAPGTFVSEMTAPLLGTTKGRELVLRSIPMRRIGDEHELDGALMFLASDASTFVTGQTIAVDGGWTLG